VKKTLLKHGCLQVEFSLQPLDSHVCFLFVCRKSNNKSFYINPFLSCGKCPVVDLLKIYIFIRKLVKSELFGYFSKEIERDGCGESRMNRFPLFFLYFTLHITTFIWN
jgi:hypothetical protein